MKPLFLDTSPRVEARLVEGYRRMSPRAKLERVREITRATQQLALLRLRARYPQATERELQLRLAALWLDGDVLRRVFGWDPDAQGY